MNVFMILTLVSMIVNKFRNNIFYIHSATLVNETRGKTKYSSICRDLNIKRLF